MNLFKITQTEKSGPETYSACIVAARNFEDAVKVHPCPWTKSVAAWPDNPTWATDPEKVNAEFIGTAARGTKPGLILASFTAR
jgi:hypothetical protein